MCSALRILQFLPDTPNVAGDASNGSGVDRSRMENRRVALDTQRLALALSRGVIWRQSSSKESGASGLQQSPARVAAQATPFIESTQL